MDIGILAIFQNYYGDRDDAEIVAGETELAELADELHYDTYWVVEHHFTDYSACPDNFVFLSNLAARTHHIRLATGAAILPWNDPLRVAEKASLLDHISEGRAVLGIGRGLSRTEYDGFRVDMNTSRTRFDESAQLVIDALETGFAEGKGEYVDQPRIELRPRPRSSFRDRFYGVGVSPESTVSVGELGAHLMVFAQQPWELFVDGSLPAYRDAWSAHQEGDPPPTMVADLVFCAETSDEAAEKGRRYMTNYFEKIVEHYELFGDHFADTDGYDMYATASEMFNAVGLETAVESYLSVQAYGTPDEILEKYEARRSVIGDFDVAGTVWFGGMPLDEAEASMRLFAAAVMPELRRW